MKAEVLAFRSLLWKEILRFYKVFVQTILSPLINSGLYLLVFGVSLSGVLSPHPGVDYLTFLIPGILALGAYNNALQNSASSIMVSKFHGDIQDVRLIPLSSFWIAVAYSLGALIRGVAVALSILIIAEVFAVWRLGHMVLPQSPLWAIYFLVVGCLIFGNIGIGTAFLAKTFDQINAVTSFIILPLIYLGGVFFPISGLSPFWQNISHVNPLVYLIEGLRWGFLGTSHLEPTFCAIIVLGFLIVSSLWAWHAVKKGSFQRF